MWLHFWTSEKMRPTLNGGGMKRREEEEGGGGSDRCSVQPGGPLPRAAVSPYRASAGSMIALHHMMAKTNVLLLKCRQGSWGELCMYTNELCCRMLSWWLPSLLDIDPSGVKTGRKEEGDQQQQQQQHGTLPWHRTRKFKVFSEMFSQATEPPVEANLNYISIHIIFFLPVGWMQIPAWKWELFTAVFFLSFLWKFWLLHESTRPKMGSILTANDNNAGCPLTSEDPFCSQMCFDCANENLSGKSDTLDLTPGPVVVFRPESISSGCLCWSIPSVRKQHNFYWCWAAWTW